MPQAPLRGCRCEPLVRKLENQLQATKEEMKAEVHAVQDVISGKVGQQELRSRQQVSNTLLPASSSSPLCCGRCNVRGTPPDEEMV